MNRIRPRLRWWAARSLRGIARTPAGRRMLSNGRLEHALCLALIPDRMQLPSVALGSLFPGAESVQVTVDRLPEGDWRTELQDLVSLLKIVRVAAPKLVLELGSYRGTTAAYLARNVAQDARVVAVDVDPGHGAVYRGTELEERITRRTGSIGPQLFAHDSPASYDLIFVDASHTHNDVRRHTEIALGLLAPHGHIVWHDYSNFGYFNRSCEVPEYLEQLAASKPVVHVSGSTLAIHSPAWTRDRLALSPSGTIRP